MNVLDACIPGFGVMLQKKKVGKGRLVLTCKIRRGNAHRGSLMCNVQTHAKQMLIHI